MAVTAEKMMARTGVPFSDISAQNAAIAHELNAAVQRVVSDSSFVLGPAVTAFEESFADYCETKFAVGCNSGTSAIHLALRALGVGPGDEVITVSHTFVGTVWGILYSGATPVFVDIEADTMLMDVERVESAISERTRAIIPVHLYGHPVDMDPLMDIARRHGLYVVEDAAQAHGARYKGRRVGSLGDIACFSFYPGKNLGAWGEAGAALTADSELAGRMRQLRDHAQPQRYQHQELGYNYRMDGIQGAVLGVKLRYLDSWNEQRREWAGHYSRALSQLSDLGVPVTRSWAEPVYHLYVVRHPRRDELQRGLSAQGIATGLHYPVPVHLQPALQESVQPIPVLRNTEQAAQTALSLPMFAELDRASVDRVITAVTGQTGEIDP